MATNSSVRCTETTSLLRASSDQASSPCDGNASPATLHKDKDNTRPIVYACFLGCAIVTALFVWISNHSYDHFQSPQLSRRGNTRVYLEGVEEGLFVRVDSSAEGNGEVVATEAIPWAAGSALTVVLGDQDCWQLKSTWSGKWLTAVTGRSVQAYSEDARDATCFEAVTMPVGDFSSSKMVLDRDDETLLSFRVLNTEEWLSLAPAPAVGDTSSMKQRHLLTTTTEKENTSVFRVQEVALLKGVNLGECQCLFKSLC
jgi:hypothetical protein